MQRKVEEYYRRDFRKDFFTAPELDRIFGYSLAEFISGLIKNFERPAIVELGGGTGILAWDILTFLKNQEPELFDRLTYYIYDFSSDLVKLQKKRLVSFEGKVFWVEELPQIEGVIFSNEFFDCLPVHVVKEGKELFIEDGREVWLRLEDKKVLQVMHRMGYEGLSQIVEVCVDCVDFLQTISESLLKGYHLVIDYGYTSEEMGRFPQGTVIAYSSHRIVKDYIKSQDVFDITAHVNFSLLEEYGKDFGLRKVFLKSLRQFLLEREVFLRELESLSLSEKAQDVERLSRIKTMLISMGDRFRVFLQEKLQTS